MTDKINGLVKQYALWPELQNDFQKNINFCKTTMRDFYSEVADLTVMDRKSIDTEIARFYLANEKLNRSRIDSQDVLGAAELKDYGTYQKTVDQLSKELITYITVCCLVEARHMGTFVEVGPSFDGFLSRKGLDTIESYGSSRAETFDMILTHKNGNAFFKHALKEYIEDLPSTKEYPKFLKFICEINANMNTMLAVHTHSEDQRAVGYQQVSQNFLVDNLQNFTLEETFKYLQTIFSGNDFDEDYGGMPWHNIASHGLLFAQGKINAEMFVDQAFSLEHNGGNMFNKDFLFTETNTFTFEYMSDGEEQADPIPLSQILLNAQHLGSMAGLFHLEQCYEKLININIEKLYKELIKEGKIDPQDTDLDDFNYQVEMIWGSYKNLIDALAPVKESIVKTNPELVSAPGYVDFKKIFNAVAGTNDDLYMLESETDTPDGYFDLWNYLHNEKLSPTATSKKKPFKFSIQDVATLPEDMFNKDIIGGKAYSLANMHNLGFPVPKAKVFTTDCCNAYIHHNKKFQFALEGELPKFKEFLVDSSGNPLLCSVRSGAPVSMPGMMDTVLNVGIDSTNYTYFVEKMGLKVTNQCVNKFMELFCSSRFGIAEDFNDDLQTNLSKFKGILVSNNIKINKNSDFPLDSQGQIRESLQAVFGSWNSPRAKAYRIEKGISHNIGTAAIVQHMVFGNLNDNSCTGVVFSRDCLTGENKLVGEFLPKAQGEDVVSGSVTPYPIESFKNFNPKAYHELLSYAKKLEKTTGQIQDIEFTVEDGNLYILQHRQAVCSPVAAMTLLKDKTLDSTALLAQIDPKLLGSSIAVSTKMEPVAAGLSANSGVIQGIIVKCEEDLYEFKELCEKKRKENKNFGFIFYSQLTSPYHMPIMNQTQGFITEQGGFTSHAAIIARSLNKPCVVGLGMEGAGRFQTGQIVTVDGTNGKVWLGEQPLVANNHLAKTAAKFLMKKNEVNIRDIDATAFNERLHGINNESSSWIFNLPEAQLCKEQPLKKERFLNLGQKVAMILSANQRHKLKVA